MNRILLASLLLLAPTAAPAAPHWVAAWTSAQMAAVPANQLQPAPLEGHTLRELVHVTAGGHVWRIRLSNAFGQDPLDVGAATIAIGQGPGNDRLRAGSLRRVTFSGQPGVRVAPGQDVWSDPVPLAAPAFTTVAISLRVDHAPVIQTGHGDARATSFLAPGDQVEAGSLAGGKTIVHWFQLDAVATLRDDDAGTVLALGDSITDSYMSTVDANNRWPDILAGRLAGAKGDGRPAVVNQGLGGNRVLTDMIGPRLLDRLDRDAWSVPGVRTVILLEGVNDLGRLTLEHPVSANEHEHFVNRLIDAYRTVINQARARGIRIIGGTLTPYGGSAYYHPDAANEADRQRLNGWIREPGHFDAVIDFDAVLRDPDQPAQLLPSFDSGDHIHPSVAGYRKMGEAVSLVSLHE